MAILLAGCQSALLAQSNPTGSPEKVAPTEISADLGGCSALITVTGPDGKPVYNAKIRTRIRYGFMATKKVDLEVYTSAAGQAKIVGLPGEPKRPVYFDISKDDKLDTEQFKPDENCHQEIKVQLK